MAEFYELLVHIKPDARFTNREEHSFCRIRFNASDLENDMHVLINKLSKEFNMLLPEVLLMVLQEHKRSRVEE